MALFVSQSFAAKNRLPVLVRSAVPDDAARFLEVARTVLTEGTFMVTSPEELTYTVEQERTWIAGYLEHPGRLILVAEVDGPGVVGGLAFENGPRKRTAHAGELHMSVLEEWRGVGIGRMLLEYLVAWAQQQALVEKLCLSVFANNDRAITLYRKLGFAEEGRRLRAFKIAPGQYVDEVLMYRFVQST